MLSPLYFTRQAARLFCASVFLLCLAWSTTGIAGALDKAGVETYFPSPWVVGEKDPKLAIWPLFKTASGAVDVKPPLDEAGRTVWPVSSGGKSSTEAKPELVGYAFESVDVAPVPGYSGKLINMLISIDLKGNFLDVRLLSHQEPLFVGGLGDQLMARFAGQYRGLSVKQTIRIVSDSQLGGNAGKLAPPGVAQLNGISRGTVTVELMDKSIMTSAVSIAASKLGIIGSVDPERVAKLRMDRYETMDWEGLSQAGLIHTAAFTHDQIERGFIGTPALTPGNPRADQMAIEFKVALLSLPQVGRNLLDVQGNEKVAAELKKGVHSLLVVSRGPNSFIGDDYVIAGGLNRLVLRQGETDIELKDWVYDQGLKLPAGFERQNAKVVQIAGYAGLDPARPLELFYRVTRTYGTFNRQAYQGLYPFAYRLPSAYVIPAPVPEAAWVNAWRNQALNVAILVLGLAVLTLALYKQHWLVRDSRRLHWFRYSFLAFTLIFVGWYAQGQLSIVNLTGVVEALREGRGLQFLLFDPLSLTLWIFVLGSLFVWGRGTFCGWLCPFGALQELLSKLLALTGFKGWRLHTRVDARLKWIKYAVLVAVLGCSVFMPQLSSTAAEVEPFKTSISLYFVRSWPYVAWAVACLFFSVLIYRGYCRYLCPLGAALAIMGKVRWLNWIPRREECGSPCQTCRHRCEYQAIEPKGEIVYTECFQCLDCVDIHDSADKCAPLITAKRRPQRVIAITAVSDMPMQALNVSRERN